MKQIILIIAILLLSGCTTYAVHKKPDGSVDVRVSSTRSFEAPDLHYERIGADAEFDFKAASVDNNTEAFVGMFQGMMSMMMGMMEKVMMMQVPLNPGATTGALHGVPAPAPLRD